MGCGALDITVAPARFHQENWGAPRPRGRRHSSMGGNEIDNKSQQQSRNVAEEAAARESSQPKLLSGGNPRIPKGDGDAPVQATIEAMPGWKRDVGRQLDALIMQTVADVRKAVRWNSRFYGMKGQGWFLSCHCFPKYVKVTFFRGTSLRPVPPVESKHPEVRYNHIHEDGDLDEELITRWIEQASMLPGEPLF